MKRVVVFKDVFFVISLMMLKLDPKKLWFMQTDDNIQINEATKDLISVAGRPFNAKKFYKVIDKPFVLLLLNFYLFFVMMECFRCSFLRH